MWPFGKKKPKEYAPTPEQLQVLAFAADFEAEEITLVAVSGREGVGSKKEDGEALHTITLPLPAWMDEEDGVVHEEPAVLTALADDRLLGYLSVRLPGNFIIKAKVRPARDGGKFQLVGMPEPGMDPELKAILDRQVKPVTFEAEGFATFTLSRAAGWFQTEIDWLDGTVLLTFDAKQDHGRCAKAARAAAENLAQYDASARALAVERLLTRVQEKAEDTSVDAEAFGEALGLDSVQVDENGGIALWYTNDLLWDSSVCVVCADGRAKEATIEE